MVLVDPACVAPMRYSAMQVLGGIVGKSSVRLTLEDAKLGEKGWRKVNAPIDTSFLNDAWRNDFTQSSNFILKETYVKSSEPHYEKASVHSLSCLCARRA